MGGSAPGISRSTCERRVRRTCVGVFLCVKSTDVPHARTRTSMFASNTRVIIENRVSRVLNAGLVAVPHQLRCLRVLSNRCERMLATENRTVKAESSSCASVPVTAGAGLWRVGEVASRGGEGRSCGSSLQLARKA